MTEEASREQTPALGFHAANKRTSDPQKDPPSLKTKMLPGKQLPQHVSDQMQ